MKDVKDELLQRFKHSLFENGMFPDEINTIINKFVLILGDYDVSERVTAVSLYDTTSDELLKIYAGSLLTEGKSTKTVYMYVRILQRFYTDLGKPLTKVTVSDVRLWLARMQQNISLCTCENYRSYLSAFYQWATREEIIDKNPMLRIKPITVQQKIRPAFDDVEIDKLRQGCNTLRERAELELLLASGARVSELCNMDICDINLITHDVIIRQGKGNKQRKSYMTDMCAFYLKKYLDSRTDDNPSLFISKFGERMSKNSVRNDMTRIGNRAGVKNVHPHRCRRQFGTNNVKKGMDIRTVQILMGHSDINTTTTYVSLADQHIKNEYMRYC